MHELVVLHHSATYYGSAEKFYHDKGYNPYNIIIENGISEPDTKYDRSRDGKIVLVRSIEAYGNHSAGAKYDGHSVNKRSIGICIVGELHKGDMTPNQSKSLKKVLNILRELAVEEIAKGRLEFFDIVGHKNVKNTLCPGRLPTQMLSGLFSLPKNYAAA